MSRVEVTRMLVPTAFRLGLLAGFLALAGCSGPPPGDKKDDPALKASMEKSMELYKSKSQAIKGNKGGKGGAAAPKRRP